MITAVNLIREDWKRYLHIHKKRNLFTFFLVFFHNPGMSFSLLYRIEYSLLTHSYLKYIGYVLYPIYFLITYFILDVDIPPLSRIGKGLYIHNKNVVTSDIVTGNNLTLIGPLTIGRNLGKKESPILGNNITICAGARIIGGIRIRDNVIVGANAVVISNIPKNVIVGGIPAKIIKKISTKEFKSYILN